MPVGTFPCPPANYLSRTECVCIEPFRIRSPRVWDLRPLRRLFLCEKSWPVQCARGGHDAVLSRELRRLVHGIAMRDCPNVRGTVTWACRSRLRIQAVVDDRRFARWNYLDENGMARRPRNRFPHLPSHHIISAHHPRLYKYWLRRCHFPSPADKAADTAASWWRKNFTIGEASIIRHAGLRFL